MGRARSFKQFGRPANLYAVSPPFRMITSIIFDLDGLLADTERLHCLAYQDALRAHGAAAVTDHEYAEHWVRSGRESANG